MLPKNRWFAVIVALLFLLPVAALGADLELVSRSSYGDLGNGPSGEPAINADGRFVIFTSDATNLVDNDHGSWYWKTDPDVFIFDRDSGAITNASRALNSSGWWFMKTVCQKPTIDAQGDLAAFECFSGYHFAHGMKFDIYLYDRSSDAIALATRSMYGRKANGGSRDATLSADGGTLAFTSAASNLLPEDRDGISDIYLWDTNTYIRQLASINASGIKGNGASSEPVLSADGNLVVFASAADNLTAADTNQAADIFVRNRQTGSVQRYSSPHNTDCSAPAIDGTGNLLAFVATDENGTRNIYLSANNGTPKKIAQGSAPALSTDGRYLAYVTTVPATPVGVSGVFRRDLNSGNVELISTPLPDTSIEGVSTAPALSAHGAELVFASTAGNLVADDDNAVKDVFLAIATADTTPPVVTLDLSATVIWPPNKKFVPVQVNGSATDDNELANVEITVSDEYGSMIDQFVPGFGSTIWLEAWRDGDDKDGRLYTITATATDAAGNSSEEVSTVLVPHDMRDKK